MIRKVPLLPALAAPEIVRNRPTEFWDMFWRPVTVAAPPPTVVIDAVAPALYCAHSMLPEFESGKNPLASDTTTELELMKLVTVKAPLFPDSPASVRTMIDP